MDTLVTTLQNLKNLTGPQFLHVVTKKGKGFSPAEENPCDYHGVTAFDPQTGEILKARGSDKSSGPTYTQVFGDWICDMAASDERLIGITPAMREGSGLVRFSNSFPDRYYDVGIAEQHSVTLAAGMACEGLKPVVAIYSTFLQRAYDQLIHDVALQNLPVMFAIDRAGLVGPDGPTHAGSFDLSYLRCIPNMVVMAPADENECRHMLYTGFMYQGPSAIRYPRGRGPGARIDKDMQALPIGKAETVIKGKSIAIVAAGSMVQPAVIVGQQLGATVVNLRFIKPLDETLLIQLATNHDYLITVEENAIEGGAGSAINEFLVSQHLAIPVLNLGIPDQFIEQGTREECLAACGLDSSGIMLAIKNFLAKQSCDNSKNTLAF
jgi:1-deoxy-D-xylulose-5-phosphate synthase